MTPRESLLAVFDRPWFRPYVALAVTVIIVLQLLEAAGWGK
jgi:hypothetical protein